MRKRLLSLCLLAAAGSVLAAAKVEETMTVRRCQAVLKDGSQCTRQTEDGARYCWRHKGPAKAVRETAEDFGEGACDAWRKTRAMTTNIWQGTKSGVDKAFSNTRDVFDEAGDEMGKGLRRVFKKDASKEKGAE